MKPLAPVSRCALAEPTLAAYAIMSAISAPAQWRASMAMNATWGRSVHIRKALNAATQGGPSFCRNTVSRSTRCSSEPLMYMSGSPAPTQSPSW